MAASKSSVFGSGSCAGVLVVFDVLTTVEVDGTVVGEVLVGMPAVVSVSVVIATSTDDEESPISLAPEHAPMMRNETKTPIV